MPILAALAEREAAAKTRRQAEPVAANVRTRRRAATRRRGRASRRSRSSRASTTRRSFPSCGMLCASLRHRGDEFVAWPRTLAQFRDGPHDRGAARAPVGQPARAARATASAGATSTSRGLDLPTDPNGLPMHGNLRGAPFEVVRAEADARGARLVARLDYGARPDLLRAFPFPHVVTIDARLDDRGLRLIDRDRADRSDARCRSRSAGTRSSSCPATPRASGSCGGRACERVLVDERVHPDRRARRAAAPSARRSADRTFDDHYALGTDRRFALARRRAQRRAALRPDVSVRAALRARARQLRGDRADDRDDRRARPRHRADGRSPANASARGSRIAAPRA